MRRLQGLLMPLGPFLGAGWVGGDWRAFRWGCVSFLLSQAVHLPLVWSLAPLLRGWGLLVVMCFLAGLCEEPARLAVKRWRRLEADEAVMFGCGHAFCEAFLLGLLVFLTAGSWTLWAVVERCSASCLHVAASVLVFRGALGRAVLLHGTFNLLVVGCYVLYGVVAAELLALALAGLLVGWVAWSDS